ncbi:protein of unknown function (plasmid) [Pararobbsia alpina]
MEVSLRSAMLVAEIVGGMADSATSRVLPTSVLAMIALLFGYEAVSRFFSPVPIHLGQAVPIAEFGLLADLASV